MAIYRVFLGNPTAETYRWQDLVEAVDALIMPAINLMQQYDEVIVRSVRSRPQLQHGEVLCYVLRSQFSSLAGRRFGVHPDPGHGGRTLFDNGTGGGGVLCEVYMRGQSLEQLARCIVHELLHAKTGMGNDQMHPLGGLCASPPTAPINPNYQLMARYFPRPLSQWLDGF